MPGKRACRGGRGAATFYGLALWDLTKNASLWYEKLRWYGDFGNFDLSLATFLKSFLILGKLVVITEFCSSSNLQNFFKSKPSELLQINLNSNLTYRQLLKIAVDVASGMVHLSSQKVFQVHERDWKRECKIGVILWVWT